MEHGAKVDVCDQRGGITPLHDAVSFGSKEVVMALLEAGARAGRKMDGLRSSVADIFHDNTIIFFANEMGRSSAIGTAEKSSQKRKGQ